MRQRLGRGWQTAGVIIRLAKEWDFPDFVRLAGQVEHWFGPMVADPGFHRAVREHVHRSAALVAVTSEVVGAMLFGAGPPVHHIHWLVVDGQERGSGVGRALLAEVLRRFGPGPVEVITFGADHPGAVASGARTFYERHGFTPAEPADPGPEGGSRQVYRRIT